MGWLASVKFLAILSLEIFIQRIWKKKKSENFVFLKCFDRIYTLKLHERETTISSKQVQYVTFEWLQWDWIHNQWGCRVMVAMTDAFSNLRLRKRLSVGLKNNISLPLHQINKTPVAESPPYSIVPHLKENEGDRLTTMTPK